jgi:hypothetical protein
LWVATFDCDIDRTYVYTSLDKMRSAIGSHIMEVLPDRKEVEMMVNAVLDKLDESIYTPVVLNGEPLVVRRIDLDRHNPVHRTLSDCYDLLGQIGEETAIPTKDLRGRIAGLFF